MIFEVLIQIYHVLLPILIIANIFFAITIVFIQRKNPISAISWLVVLFLLPFIGFFLFLIFGQYYRKEKMFAIKSGMDHELLRLIESQVEEVKIKGDITTDRWSGAIHRMALLLLQNNQAIITVNNQIKAYTDGKAKFADLVEAINGCLLYTSPSPRDS